MDPPATKGEIIWARKAIQRAKRNLVPASLCDKLGVRDVHIFDKFGTCPADYTEEELKRSREEIISSLSECVNSKDMILTQYLPAVLILGSNWLSINGIRRETKAEVDKRTYLSTLTGEELEKAKKPRILIHFEGIEEMYAAAGADAKEIEVMKTWYSVPPFWEAQLKSIMNTLSASDLKKTQLGSTKLVALILYVYDGADKKMLSDPADDSSTPRTLVFGKGKLIIDSFTYGIYSVLHNMSDSRKALMFPYLFRDTNSKKRKHQNEKIEEENKKRKVLEEEEKAEFSEEE